MKSRYIDSMEWGRNIDSGVLLTILSYWDFNKARGWVGKHPAYWFEHRAVRCALTLRITCDQNKAHASSHPFSPTITLEHLKKTSMPASESPPSARTSTDKASNVRTPNHRRSQSAASVLDSPLKQVNLSETQEPQAKPKLKVVSLYESLFTNNEPHQPGFWVEFFLLPVNVGELERVLNEAQPLSNHTETVQTVFFGAVANLSQANGKELPKDIIKNALLILQEVFKAVLQPNALNNNSDANATNNTNSSNGNSSKSKSKGKSKKGKAKRSAIAPPQQTPLQTLVGLEKAHTVLDELTSSVLNLLRHTSNPDVVTYAADFMFNTAPILQGTQLSGLYTTKNFFAALLNVVNVLTNREVAYTAIKTIGILTALNVYDDDGVPVYQQRISDYVDEAVMIKMIALFQRAFSKGPAQQTQNTWSSGLLSWFKGATSGEDSSVSSSDEGPYLLPLFFFVLHNPIFCSLFVSSPTFISVMEYFAPQLSHLAKSHHQHADSWIAIALLKQVVDNDFQKLVDESQSAIIRIDAPKLALDLSRRTPLAGILDLAQVGLRAGAASIKHYRDPKHAQNKNSVPPSPGKVSLSDGHKPHTDWELLDQFAGLLYQACAHLVQTKTMWQNYNWTGLFKFILGLVKYILNNIENTGSNIVTPILTKLVNVLVGVTLSRDLLDEEDWTYMLYTVVKMPQLFADLAKVPSLDQLPAIAAARAMTAQYDLDREKPDLAVVVKQGSYAAGTNLLEPLRPMSLNHPMVKKAVLANVHS